MACQKVCKQGRDDIIVKVNLQSPIPTSFCIAVTNQCQNDAGMWLCKFTFTIISSLPCLHTFWHAIPTSFYIFNVFKSCSNYNYHIPNQFLHYTWGPTSYTNITNPCMHAHIAFQYHMHEPLKVICAGFGWVHDTESGVVWVSFVRLYSKTLSPTQMCTELGTFTNYSTKQNCCDLAQVLTPSSNKVISNRHFELF